MTRRHIHYESAFEDYLRSRGLPYIAVNEQRKAIFAGTRVKSLDFVVYRRPRTTWLIDIKGRKFPYQTRSGRRYWENWVPRGDLDDLLRWQETFGSGFKALLVFAYWVLDETDRRTPEYLHPYRNQYYAFLCVRADEYVKHCRTRSSKWNTVALPGAVFRRVARPIERS